MFGYPCMSPGKVFFSWSFHKNKTKQKRWEPLMFLLASNSLTEKRATIALNPSISPSIALPCKNYAAMTISKEHEQKFHNCQGKLWHTEAHTHTYTQLRKMANYVHFLHCIIFLSCHILFKVHQEKTVKWLWFQFQR